MRDLDRNKRMAIAGAAGTGKTVLALNKAITLAEQGLRTLFLCFNRPLSLYLQEAVKSYPQIMATHFHQFCRDIAKAAGTEEPGSIENYETGLVDNFVAAEMEEYDAVIIDEGQDFKDDWLESLEVVVKNIKEGFLYIFFDDNQDVMSTSAGYISNLPIAQFHLSRNFRNTKEIFKQANRYYSGDHVRAIGPTGRPINWYGYKGPSEFQKMLAERIGTLVQSEKLDLGSIAILAPDAQTIDSMFPHGRDRIGRYPAADAERRTPERLVIETVRRFKGLESPVVLIILTHEIKSYSELLYTGMTRAQSLLEVFAPKLLKEQLINE
jgi:superfamily I DNA and RNA helicase